MYTSFSLLAIIVILFLTIYLHTNDDLVNIAMIEGCPATAVLVLEILPFFCFLAELRVRENKHFHNYCTTTIELHPRIMWQGGVYYNDAWFAGKLDDKINDKDGYSWCFIIEIRVMRLHLMLYL